MHVKVSCSKASKPMPINSLRPSVTYMHHILLRKHAIIGSDNGLSSDWHQTIIQTNAAILSTRPWGTYFSQIVFKIKMFSFIEMHFKCCLWNGSHFVLAQCVKPRETVWHYMLKDLPYRQFSTIKRTQSQNINGSRLVLQLSLPNPLKPGVKLRMKM